MSKVKSKVVTNEDKNTVKDISICLRIRPLLENELEKNYFETCVSDANSSTKAYIHEPAFRFDGKPTLKTQKFDFDYVFGPEDNNQKVYMNTIYSMVELVLSGAMGVCLCYGQTGSGKTYTMTGIEEYLAVDIFKKMETIIERMNLKSLETYNDKPFEVKVSFFEIMGNQCYDLLNNKEEISILEDKFGSVVVKNLQEYECQNSEELLNYINIGAAQRKTCATLKNDTSSRSHAICQIKIHNTVINQANDGILFLVDLAGSERHADSKFHNNDRIKETKEINTSLLTLKECIRARSLSALGSSQHIHIPFRTSKLTTLLKETFDLETCTRPCTTLFIANVSPNCLDSSHTLNTLRYSSPLKITQKNRIDILAKKKYNPKDPSSWEYEHAAAWIEKASNGAIKPQVLIPNKENGIQLSNIPEMEFIRRCLLCHGMTEKRAKQFYLKLWGLIIDCRTKQKRMKLASKNKHHVFEKTGFNAQELLDRLEEERRSYISKEDKRSAREIMEALNGRT